MRRIPSRSTAETAPKPRSTRTRRMSSVALFASLMLMLGAGSAAATPTAAAPRGAAPDCSSSGTKCIALTFDDGPAPRTADLLDILDQRGVRSTFFMVGRQIERRPATVRLVNSRGHEVANHSANHPDLTKLSKNEIRAEISEVNKQIRREIGFTPTLMRPPYGETNATVKGVIEEFGMTQVLWNVDSEDWKDHDAETIERRVLADAKPSAVVLMHDIHNTTIEAVPEIIDGLAARGYTMVTVSQLLNSTHADTHHSEDVPTLPHSSGPVL
ncbi:polysaccharide deacetylase family protein [Nocardiopsis gilva]|uniref:polysaccharide deacetylase family protein n=1 Tax=Nocardiopsis gilva TaxID=280236 RepID=UPI000346D294|nr:polysaccharide deacetylase family protein [Nocardiopsis gilva]